MTERRFNDEEVAAIFARATEAEEATRLQPTLPLNQGMTLAQLQEIGREAGISPELVRQAAATLNQRGAEVTRRFLGFPIGVGTAVELDRTLSNAEWELLVSDLRQTFDATGRVRQEGSVRLWGNGNLHAVIEPIENGQRVRLRTVNANASVFMMGGLGVLTLAAAFAIALAIGAAGHLTVGKVSEIGIMGAMIFSLGAFQVPTWARRRRQQMDDVIGRMLGKITRSA